MKETVKEFQGNERDKEINRLSIVSALFIVFVFTLPLLKKPNITLIEQGSMGFRAEEAEEYTLDQLIYFGDLNLRAGNADKAIDYYTRAITLNPKSSAAYHLRGIAYYKKGNKEQAIQDLRRAVELNPNQDYMDILAMVEAGGGHK